MEYVGANPLPFRETTDMCPNIAIYTLNKNGYSIPYVAENYPLGELVRTINSFILVKKLVLKSYFGAGISIGAILRRKGDGILILDTAKGTSHVIAFIIENGKITFYDANSRQLNKYVVKDDATILSFTSDFVKLFPAYTISQVYIMESTENMQGGNKQDSYKLKALETLKYRNLTPMMVYTALLNTNVLKGQVVVSKMFGFKSWGHLTNDHVLEVKNKDGSIFRYKIGYRKKNQNYHSLLAKVPGSFYTQIFTHRAFGYDSDADYERGVQAQKEMGLTRKLKLKPRYRKTRKNRR